MNAALTGTAWGPLRKTLTQYLTKKSGDRALAEDLAQEVFLKYHEKEAQIRDPGKLHGWLFRIASNLLIDHYRAKRRLDALPAVTEQSSDGTLNACLADCLKEELQQLPEAYRTLLTQAEIESVSQVQLAEEHQLSYSGVKSRVQRGRRMLRERLEDKYLLAADSYGNILRCESRTPGNSCPSC